MKLKDLMTEQTLEARVEIELKKIDWDYDLDATNEKRLTRGQQTMDNLLKMVSKLHTEKPELAEALWEAYCPYAQPGSLKALIHK